MPQGIFRWLSLFLLVTCLLLCGCENETQKDKVSDLEFTIASDDEIPDALKEIIESKKEEPFKLLYIDEGYMYMVIGYGMQPTTGYSIEVKDVYLTDTMVVIDTNLLGPSEKAAEKKTYPVVAVKTKWIDLPVMYK